MILSLALVGCQGTNGVKGDKGDSGEQGIQGMQGLQGQQGIQGLQGDKGNKGNDGVKGKNGEDGKDGDNGRTGVQGVKGNKGDDGIDGVDGEQGIQGEKGDDGVAGEDGKDGIAAPMLRLVQKDVNWDIIDSQTGGLLQYTPEGQEFGYCFTGFGLVANTAYSLIYYADYADPSLWGGDNPGALIASGVSNSIGGLYLIGSVNLGIDLPSAPDVNGGAKIWLVPSSCYDAMNKKVITWNPNSFLFEANLIRYNYTK